jgi:hypothetical protein
VLSAAHGSAGTAPPSRAGVAPPAALARSTNMFATDCCNSQQSRLLHLVCCLLHVGLRDGQSLHVPRRRALGHRAPRPPCSPSSARACASAARSARFTNTAACLLLRYAARRVEHWTPLGLCRTLHVAFSVPHQSAPASRGSTRPSPPTRSEGRAASCRQAATYNRQHATCDR